MRVSSYGALSYIRRYGAGHSQQGEAGEGLASHAPMESTKRGVKNVLTKTRREALVAVRFMESMENIAEILVAEDEPAVAAALKSALRFCGYAASTVPDGRAALDRIQAEPGRFALVLSDHSMPGLGGLSLVKALRATGYPGGIVILSAFLSNEIEAQYYELGVNELLSKPFNIPRLREALARALQPEACRS